MLTKKQITDLFNIHKTTDKGLTTEESVNRLKEYGENEIKSKKRKPLIIVFIEEFKDLMVIILIIASLLAFAAGEFTDATVILFIVFLNAIIGFVQKFKAERAIEALKKLVAPQARVLRDGYEQLIKAKLVVPGDILIINEGDSITADAVLYMANELEAMEAALTGESTPVQKLTYDIKETNGTEAEKENMIFMGTNITHGTGKAIVISTGMNTQMGHIATLTTETKKEQSPLEKELNRIGIFVGQIALTISALLLGIGVFIQGKEFIDTLLFASSVAVAAVPEGLPATITIALAIGVQRLAKQNAIVKQLSSVETLGSTTVICSDKTGTLTKNEMTVKEIYFDNHETSVHGVGYTPAGYLNIRKHGKDLITLGQETDLYEDYELSKKQLIQLEEKEPDLYKPLYYLMAASTLCNNASLTNKDKKWQIIGDPTEGALLTMVAKSGFKIEKLNEEYERVHEITFDSNRKRMTVIVKNKEGKYYAVVKGAPDNILDVSSRFFNDGKIEQLDAASRIRYTLKNEQMAKAALRGLGFAYRELTDKEVKEYLKYETFKKEDIEKDLIFIGLVGMIDPPRPDVRDAVEMAHKAHIRIYVITGDHGLTAEAIARQLNIVTPHRKHKIITGTELNEIKDKELINMLANKEEDIIFARVSPQHKLRIVTQLKKLGEIVAVTGDGVNDAPALKKADIGIAMGITGTDVSKEASNMVLADDSFSTIIKAIKEGRTIYENLKKFVFYVFSCNIGELITIFAAILLSLPAPLTAILILAIDLGTDVLPAVALGIDPSEPGIMDRKPRDPKERIMNKRFVGRYLYLGIFMGIIVMIVYISTLYRYGWSWGEPLPDTSIVYLKGATMAFATLVIIQMINAFNSRSETNSVFTLGLFSNVWLLGAIGISLVFTVLMVELPFLQYFLGTTGLNYLDWIIIISFSLLVLVIEELRKWIAGKKPVAAVK